MNSVVSGILSNLLIINTILAIFVIIMERRNPRNTWLWIMILVLMPGVGFLFYLWLGRDFNKRKMFRAKGELDARYKNLIQNEILNHKKISQIPHKYQSIMDMLLKNSKSGIDCNNTVEPILDGGEFFDRLIADILDAKKYVYIQTYIMKSDNISGRLMDALIKKAKEGLDVKLLSDGMGARLFKKKDIKRLRENGVDVEIFFPFFLSFISPRINFRNHRKIFVIDGEIGYVGGFNVGDEYIDGGKEFDYWRDAAVRIRGASVNKLQLRFEMDFRFAAGSRNVDFHAPSDKSNKIYGDILVQIVTSGPDGQWPSVKDGILKMINSAKKSIYIETPYFIPDDSVLESLRVAALSGVDIKVMLPYKGDHIFVFWANLAFAGELLKAGAKFYYYNAGFNHAKVMIIDEDMLTVGTANMDERSFILNFEANAFIYDEKTAKLFVDKFKKDILDHSSELTPELYAKRNIWVKIKENVSRLFSPLL